MQLSCKALSERYVLLIGTGFYDYEQAIADELRRQGAIVFIYDQLPSHLRRGALASLLRRFKVNVSRQIKKHHQKILDEMSKHHIDYTLVIKGEHMNPWFLNALRKSHNGIKLITYHWDSLSRYPELVKLQSHYDRVFSFDNLDAENFKDFKFRPLFYRPEIAECSDQNMVKKFDLCFVGWLHHERLSQIHKIHRFARNTGLSSFFHLYTGLFSKLRMLINGESAFLATRAINFFDYVRILHSSRIVVDLPHPAQTGLTMRVIEAIGAGKKLITTSKTVEKYKFYDPANILIIDPVELMIDPSFISSPYKKTDAKISEQYSLNSWVNDVFELKSPDQFFIDDQPFGT